MKNINLYKVLSFIIFVSIVFYEFYYDDVNDSYSMEVNGENVLEVTFLDVGQGDSILIQNNDKNMLIDAGNNEDGMKLVNYFNDLNISDFDYVVGTHPHEDHIGGLDDVINNFNVDKVLLPDVTTTSNTFVSLLDAIQNKNLAIDIPKIGDTFKLGDAIIKVIYTGNDEKDLNNSSIVLKLIYGHNSFLFTGDATKSVEKIIMDDDIDCDVLKVGHHGSSYSSSINFLRAVNPKYAIISVGNDNSYGHPHNITINNLKSLGVKVYRTDKLGSIKVTSDGNNIYINSFRSDTNG